MELKRDLMKAKTEKTSNMMKINWGNKRYGDRKSREDTESLSE